MASNSIIGKKASTNNFIKTLFVITTIFLIYASSFGQKTATRGKETTGKVKKKQDAIRIDQISEDYILLITTCINSAYFRLSPVSSELDEQLRKTRNELLEKYTLQDAKFLPFIEFPDDALLVPDQETRLFGLQSFGANSTKKKNLIILMIFITLILPLFVC